MRLHFRLVLQLNELKVRHHMDHIDTCSLCLEECESLEHALSDCKWTKQVWMAFNIHNNSLFFQKEIINWLHVNICGSKHAFDTTWSIVFGVILDRVWWRRNEFVFRNKWTSSEGVVGSVLALTEDIIRSKECHKILSHDDYHDYSVNSGGRKPIC